MIWAYRAMPILFALVVAAVTLVGGVPATGYTQELDSAAEVENEVAARPEFVYSPAGRRDPFAPLIQQIRKKNSKPEKVKGPLEKYELSQFRLMAMLIIQGTPRAMVKAPDGKSYTVKPGDLIGANNGVVVRIETKTSIFDEASGQMIEKNPDRVVVEEIGIDSYTGVESKEYRYIEM